MATAVKERPAKVEAMGKGDVLTVPAGLLGQALGDVERVIEARNTVPILSNVKLVASGGVLKVTGTNLDMILKRGVAADGALSTTVEAKRFGAMVRALPGDSQVRLSVEGGSLVIKGGRTRWKLPVLPIEDFPDIATGEMPGELTLAGTALAAALSRVEPFQSSEEVRYFLNGTYLHALDGMIGLAATDGHKLARLRLGQDWPGTAPSIIVPRKVVALLDRLFAKHDGDVTLFWAADKMGVHWDEDGLPQQLIGKTVDGTFPDYPRVIPAIGANRLTVDADALAEAVRRVVLASEQKTRAVRTGWSESQMSVACGHSSVGEGEEEVPASGEGELTVGFNGNYLAAICGLFGGTMHFTAADAGSPCLITPDGDRDGDFIVTLMPMRV